MRKTPHRQSGIGLLLLLVMTGMLAVLVIVNLLPKQPTEQERERITQEALARAKEALIAYAVAHMDQNATEVNVPGYLPCPVTADPTAPGNEGKMELGCGTQGVTAIGPLPFKTLGIQPLRDGYGECLWYAVSGSFKIGLGGVNDAGRAPMVNWDTVGQIRVLASDGVTVLVGNTPETMAAAIVIAPGRARGQTRTPSANATQCQNSTTVANYLERDGSLTFGGNPVLGNTSAEATAWDVSTFVNGRPSLTGGEPIINDRILAISPRDIFDAVGKRKDFIGTAAAPGKLRLLALNVATCLAGYSMENPVVPALPNPAQDRRLVWGGKVDLGSLANLMSSDQYVEVPNRMEGRVPFVLGPVTTSEGDRSGNANEFRYGTGCNNGIAPPALPPPLYWNSDLDAWWEHWKDHLFFAGSPDFAPDTTPAPPTSYGVTVDPDNVTCNGKCLTVNSDATKPYAGIVLFAGRPLPGQRRVSLAERVNPQNYLEGVNPVGIGANDPSAPQLNYDTVPSGTLNDLAVCIRFTADAQRNPDVAFC